MSVLLGLTPYVVGLGFFLFLASYFLYSVYAIHHLNEFGYSGDASQSMLRFYFGFTIVVLVAALIGLTVGFFTL